MRARKSAGLGPLLAAVVLCLPVSARADIISRLGGAAYYDSVLDITWLTNANLADSESFGVAGIASNGAMTWSTANEWITAMNAASYLGFSDWRLPTLSPVSGSAFNYAASNNGSTDVGFADGDGWIDAFGNPTSEMGHMYYVNLGNLGRCTPNDGDPSSCVEQPGFGLANSGPFDGIQKSDPGAYWNGLEYAPVAGTSWVFRFYDGGQDSRDQLDQHYVWAVRTGDVATVPEPTTLVLLSAGLSMLGLIRRKRIVH
jgi:hypothetical protein